MKHPSNRDLFAYWNKQRGTRLAPERNDIEPSEIRHVLGDTFVLAANPMTSHPLRLAGTRLCALFGRELKNESFVKLWAGPSQNAVRELLAVVTEEKVGVVASATAAVAEDAVLAVNMELILLPLMQQSPADGRVLGALAPMAAPYWLGAKSVGPMTLGSFRHIGPAVEPTAPPRLIAVDGRIRRGLTVYQGGRVD
jgi:hypothetical protein